MQNLAGRVKTYWEDARTQLWFIPTVMVILMVIVAFALLYIDRHYTRYFDENFYWLFSGTPDATRSVLSTIATSVITVISIAFSLTIIALQQASVQFTPRVLRNFTSDQGNQIVLGTYIATFIYSLLILRSVRNAAEGGAVSFVPSLSTTIALLLALLCMGMLIFFISHIARTLQASVIIAQIHKELREQIEHLYPARIGKSAKKTMKTHPANAKVGQAHLAITAEVPGFVVYVDEKVLGNLPLRKKTLLSILPQVGDFIVEGQIIAKLYDYKKLDVDIVEQIRGALIVNGQRTLLEDPLFAIRQLVDIALKALSPGINDPTTASYCIRYLTNGLTRLSSREFPDSYRTFEGTDIILHLNRPTWDEFVAKSYSQIQIESRENLEVTLVLLRSIHELAIQVTATDRKPALRQLIKDAKYNLRNSNLSQRQKKEINHVIEQIEAEL